MLLLNRTTGDRTLNFRRRLSLRHDRWWSIWDRQEKAASKAIVSFKP